MPESATDSGLTFLDYLRPVWRFKVIVLIVVALAAVGAYLYTNRQTKVYQTSTQLYVGQSSLQQLLSPTSLPLSATSVANQALLLTTPAVADAVRTRLKLSERPQALLDAMQVTPSATTDFLTITATSTSPTRAAALANGFARAYLQVAGRNLVRSAQGSLQAAENRLHELAGGIANDPARLGLRQQIATLEGIISSPPSSGEQPTPAAVPGTPVSPKPTRDAIFAAAIALVLAVILSYLFDRSDRRVRSLDEVESLFELPVLANVPHIRDASPSPQDPYATPPELREPIRTLRVSLDLTRSTSNGDLLAPKVIMVASGLPSEGKSTIVSNLAISYREAGLRVAVLEADLRRPVLADRFGLEHGPGMSEALTDQEDVFLQRVPDSGEPSARAPGEIDVAVAGDHPDDPTVLLTEERLEELISRVAYDHDVVLIDSAPLLAVSDGLPLLGIADAVLLVVRAGTVTRPAAARLRATIDRLRLTQHVNMLGIVANDVTDELRAYYDGGYGYGYGYREPGKSANGKAGRAKNPSPDLAA